MTDPTTLDTLFSFLYGPVIGRPLAELAAVQDDDRVIVVGSDERGPSGSAFVEDSMGIDTGLTRDGSSEIADPLPTVEMVQWGSGAQLANRLAGGWDVVVGFPPQGGPNGEELLTEFLQVLRDTARPGARAVLFVVSSLLSRVTPTTRSALLKHGAVRSLLFPSGPPPRSLRIESSARLTVAQWWPGQVDARSTHLTRLSQTGDIEGEFDASLVSDQGWSYEALDPQRAANLASWARRTGAVRLPELVSFPKGSKASETTLRPLSPRQITPAGIDLTIEGRPYDSPRDGALTGLLPGDIVGRTLGDPNWTAVREADGRQLGATRQAIVIRPVEIDTSVLLAFLRSDAAALQIQIAEQGSTIPRISQRALQELLVPTVLRRGVGAHSDDLIREFRSVSTTLADELSARYRSAFNGHKGESIVEALADASGEAEMALDLVRRVRDPLHRARQFLPHPLARLIRAYDSDLRGGTAQDIYGDLLRFGETAITMLGIVGLAFIETNVNESPALVEWRVALRKGGVSLGVWLASANAGAEHARRAGQPLGGVAAALATRSPLNQILDEFLAERNNNAHGSGPRSPMEFELRSVKLDELLQVALAELSPLARAEWFTVSTLRWSSQTRRFTAQGRSLAGDHPDFARWQSERDEPIESGVVIARFGDVDLSLDGYCQLRACPTCLNEELYYPDRLRGSMLRVRSLDRGHSTEVALADSGLSIAANVDGG